jgi:hypothetical protein
MYNFGCLHSQVLYYMFLLNFKLLNNYLNDHFKDFQLYILDYLRHINLKFVHNRV